MKTLINSWDDNTMETKAAQSSNSSTPAQDRTIPLFKPVIFVSYAHEDSRWFEKRSLMPRLISSLERVNAEVWYDKGRIKGADIWKDEIESAIDRADIAILLVSQFFLNSDFIMRIELPRLAKRAEAKQLVIFPILVGYCEWEAIETISRPQMMPGEPTPLVEYLEPEARWEKVQYEILQALLRQIEKIRKEREKPKAQAGLKGGAKLTHEPVMPVPGNVDIPPSPSEERSGWFSRIGNLLRLERKKASVLAAAEVTLSKDGAKSTGQGSIPIETAARPKDDSNTSNTDKRMTPIETNKPANGSHAGDVIQPNNFKTATPLLSPIPEIVEVSLPQSPVIRDRAPQTTAYKKKSPTRDEHVSLNPELILYLRRGEDFLVGTKDSKVRSFYYGPGTVLQYSNKGMDGGYPWYQLTGVGGKDMWLIGPSATVIDTNDKRVFFKIAETGQVGYLVNILGERNNPWGDLDGITIVDDLLGEAPIKLDQITSLSVKQASISVGKSEISVQTGDTGAFMGRLQELGNYNSTSFTIGPCLVTCDAVIALIRTQRSYPITLNRIADDEKPILNPELIYWDRSQLKFRLSARDAIGHFNEGVRDSYIHFSEQSLGWMRISIPQIKNLTVDIECQETPVILETFAGNVYRGTCIEQFNLSGAMISIDKVKNNLVLEAFDREILG